MENNIIIEKKQIMGLSLLISSLLMGIKFTAYLLTHSNGILTDAVESIVNIIAGGVALFSIYYAAKPKDEDHPYGHGKIEFFSSGFEGGMITLAGIGMVAKGVLAFIHKENIHSVDIGIYLSAFAGIVNYITGYFLIKKGKKSNSYLMIANGKHLISDTISSLGLIVGLTIVYFTGLLWVDYLIAIIFGIYIIYSGFSILKESVTNLLDKADYEKINHLIEILNKNRKEKWIDIHNLRILKYGSLLHVDCHITLPWYENLEDSHNEVDSVEKLVKNDIPQEIEFFIHADPCLPASCPVCLVKNCKERKSDFAKKIEWKMENVLPDKKHKIEILGV